MTMPRTILILTAALMFLVPHAARAAMDHAAHKGNVVHESVVDGVKATFSITTMTEQLRARGMALPKGMTETHHLAAEFKEAKSGQILAKGLVAVRLQGPGQSGEPRELVGMDGHFGIDLDLSRPGNYGFMCRFVLADGKKRQAIFRYEVK